MPELPEVETIRRSLLDLVGTTIDTATFSAVAPVKHISAAQLQMALAGQRLMALERRGKYLLFRLSSDNALILHLGMSGRIRRVTDDAPAPKHTHMTLQLSNGCALRYVDARRFGVITLATHALQNPYLANLGPEFDDPQFTAVAFIAQCRRHPNLSLKMALLNQWIVAGLGNIYVCEVLYEAGLNPTRPIASTTETELTRVHAAIRAVLTRAITHGGTSLRDYEDSWGQKGGMKAHLQVYGRDGESTLDGRGSVVRIVQQGRSTWFAPEIQK